MKLKINEILLVAGMAGAAFWLTYFAPVDYSGFDPLGNLATAQAMLRHGTIKLDADRDRLPGYVNGWHLREKSGHLYYHYPLGTPLIALPFVWAANRAGWDMTNRDDDAALQNLLSALTTSGACALLYLVCRLYAPVGVSCGLAGAFAFGSSIVSTLGTALWNVNAQMLFLLLGLWLLLRHVRGAARRHSGYWVGLCFSCAYLCRPTALIVIGVAVGYCAVKDWRFGAKIAAVYLLVMAALAAFSWHEYRQLLPDYYLPQQLGAAANVWTALRGHLVSPSRGVLVYSPHLLVTLFACGWLFGRLWREPLFWFAAAWIAGHLALIAKNSMWWGGGCFGGRLFTEALPACLLLTLLAWQQRGAASAFGRRITAAAFVILAGVGMYINTAQGLYNPSTLDWGDAHLFDWRCPQFLASPECLAARDIREQQNSLEPYRLGEKIQPNGRNAIFAGWYWLETSEYGQFRWSRGRQARVLFNMDALEKRADAELLLEMRLGAYHRQRVEIFLNQHSLGKLTLDSILPTEQTLRLPAAFLNDGNKMNVLTFDLPDAVAPRQFYGKGWIRAIGVSVWRVKLREIAAN